MQTQIESRNTWTASKQVVQSSSIEIQHDRGVIYVYGRDGSPLLKITGLPRPIPSCDWPADPPSGHQLTIEIQTSPVRCTWGPVPSAGQQQYPYPAQAAEDPQTILKQAGATIVHKQQRE